MLEEEHMDRSRASAAATGSILLLPTVSQFGAGAQHAALDTQIHAPSCGWCAIAAANVLRACPPTVTIPQLMVHLRRALSPQAMHAELLLHMRAVREWRSRFIASHGAHFGAKSQCRYDTPEGFACGERGACLRGAPPPPSHPF